VRVVVDANVAVEWAGPGPDTERALALLDAELVVPDLFFPEIANVLWKKVARGELTAAEADRAADTILALDMEVVPSATLSREALELACLIGHPAYDFHYAALARRLGVQMVTADARFVRKLRDVQPAPAWMGLVMALSSL